MHNNLSDLFNLSEIKKFIYKRANLRDECRSHLLNENYQEASKVALKFFDVCPSYLFISYFLENTSSSKKLLEVIVDRKIVSPDVALFLAKENLFQHAVLKFLDNCLVKDYIYQIIRKEMIIKGHLPFDETILDILDDWDLYDYALKHKINLKMRDTVNYEYYLAHKNQSNCNLINKIKNYKELEYLSKLTNTTNHEDYATDCILNFMNYGFNLEKAKEILNELEKYQNNNINMDNFNILKVLLSHLISSKDTQLLIFALFLTYKYRKSFTSNYEISLIHLFLCRFFLFHKEVSKLFNEFNIKNNQFYSLFFIWSDLVIALDLKDKSKEEEYSKLIKENINTVEKTLKHFIEKDKIGHAVSLIKVHKKLKNEIVYKEITNKEIYSEESKTIFSNLLGKGCEYLFSKVIKSEYCNREDNKGGSKEGNDKDSKEGDKEYEDKDDKVNNYKQDSKRYIKTLFLNPFEYETFTSLFDTPLGKIEDSEFIEWFKSQIITF
ncbi:hypothetical protein NBO_11g0035 [Nosema bombycis CQ1]|uniref:Uncharacterized protein n=1 Tax=Nosema bombycis (strain CQ1 / CVCC 102059) TaxID=578461 RepID=R0MQ26_NOSB1|nr:hypothetical protein NBO_11g0035 [Nosema bombycis CQ1]|eukprot:EOB14963.1 hypothetical protein NBO_11g0035 [Nosema bombycis CQ1]